MPPLAALSTALHFPGYLTHPPSCGSIHPLLTAAYGQNTPLMLCHPITRYMRHPFRLLVLSLN